MEELTIVHLTPLDAKLFIEFQKRYAFIKLLESLNVFDIEQGSVTVHFNNSGEIRNVEVRKNYYPQVG